MPSIVVGSMLHLVQSASRLSLQREVGGAWEDILPKWAKGVPDEASESVTHLWGKAGGIEPVEVGGMNYRTGQSLMMWNKDVSISPSAYIHGLGRA